MEAVQCWSSQANAVHLAKRVAGDDRPKSIKRWRHSSIRVMKMAITLETIHKDIQQLRDELDRVRSMLADDGDLTEEVRRELKEAREEMDRGECISHEEIMAKYG